jgi:type II secretory pathway pseudopilin PulG
MRASVPKPRIRGYTITELLVSMGITLVLLMMVLFFYLNLSRGVQKAQQELAVLAAMRSTLATLQNHLRSLVYKSGYIPGKAGENPLFKPLNDGMFRIQWPGTVNHLQRYATGGYQDGKCRYIGFYSTTDGTTVDRVEYYFNPAEPSGKTNNNSDDDFDDDPDDKKNPAHLLRDDTGQLMVRIVKDSSIAVAQFHNTPPDGADQIDASGFPAYRAPRLTGTAGSEFDRGEIAAEGFSDVYFDFLYTRRPADDPAGPLTYVWTNRWPCTDDPASTFSDDSGALWPRDNSSGGQPRGVSFIALPLAVRVNFVVLLGAERRRYSQTILLPQSQWHEFTRRSGR